MSSIETQLYGHEEEIGREDIEEDLARGVGYLKSFLDPEIATMAQGHLIHTTDSRRPMNATEAHDIVMTFPSCR